MARKLIILILIVTLFIVAGCTNQELNIVDEEKEQLSNEIMELNDLISKKDERIKQLEKLNSNKNEEIKELNETVNMVRASSQARLDDYDDIFDYLEKKYKIHSDYEIKDDWYVINEDYFQIELLGYENAAKVDFYTLRVESGEGPILAFTDRDPTDGWTYTNDDIGQVIEKHKKPLVTGGFSYEPSFIIYTEVTLEDGKVISTSKLPIYNKSDN